MDGLKHCVHLMGTEVLCCFCNQRFAYGSRSALKEVVPGHGIYHPESWKQSLVGVDEICPMKSALHEATWSWIAKSQGEK